MLKLISVNIEGDKHHHTVASFLKKENPDVVCIQEIFQNEVEKYQEILKMQSFFKPLCYYGTSDPTAEWQIRGSAIFTNQRASFNSKYLIGNEKNIPVFARPQDPYLERHTINVAVLWGEIQDSKGQLFRIANTHFTWTPEGMSTEYQKQDMRELISVLGHDLKDFVLVGDLNAPRGKETFSMLAEKYKDNIPSEYDSSIDPKLHRVPSLKYMVDGLFTTPRYIIKEARLVEGISDHKAVVAIIETNGN